MSGEAGFKIVLIGDGAVGKTCLALTYQQGQFPQEYIPTITDNYLSKAAGLDLAIWDTGGREDYDRLRPLSYPGTNAFLLCFSVVNNASFQNIKSKWLPEAQHHHPSGAKVMVGTKIDLRDDPQELQRLKEKNQQPVTTKDGQKLAQELGITYVECSSLTQEGLKEVFLSATKAKAPSKPKSKSSACSLL